MALAASKVVICNQCGFENPVDSPNLTPRLCGRCEHSITQIKPDSLMATWAFSLTAMIFYIPANLFPFMTMDLYGSRNSATIWGGIIQLAEADSWFIAGVVFLASMVIPLLKLLGLFYLSFRIEKHDKPLLKTRIYRVVEGIGRWSMLDIFLLAVLVAIMKLGPWTSVEPEVGSLMFALVVIFTMFASACFDTRLLWEKDNARQN